MGRGDDFFKRITSRRVQAIDELIRDRETECLFLDFKRSADGGTGGKLHANDRDNLGKAISGFGNTEGGVIVWGVDCSGLPKDGDVAKAKVPIQNPQRFQSWLEGAVSGCTVPPHPGVVNQVIEIESGSKGFVVTHVPRSYLLPHQTVAKMVYYIRAGSSFTPASHSVLMGLFGRKPQAFIFHLWAILPAALSSPVALSDRGRLARIEFAAGFQLSNYGPGVARDLYVRISRIVNAQVALS